MSKGREGNQEVLNHKGKEATRVCVLYGTLPKQI
jgi:hypothetical protein